MNTFSVDPSILAKAESFVDQPDEDLELDTMADKMARAISKPAKKAKATVAVAKEKTKRTNTKTARALEIYKQHSGDKKAVIEAFCTELGMSKAGATTYFYNAKKAA
jgi:hypothetical protein